MQSLTPSTTNAPYRGIAEALHRMVVHEGFLRPVRGIGAVVVSAGPAHALYFSCYEYLKESLSHRMNSHLAHDPLNPFFRSNGLPASRYLYLERVTNQLRDLHTNASDEDSDKTSSATKPLQQVKLKDVPEKKPELKLEKPSRNEKMKRNFSLPLANTTCSDTGTASLSEVRFSKNQGIPLTPLMSKLSILAEEQKKQSHFENERKISPVLSLPSRIDEDCSKVEEMVDLSKSDKFTKDFTELTSRSRKISDRELSKNTESLDIVKSSVASSSKAKRKSNSRTNRSECIDENGTGDDKELVEVVLCVLGRLSTCLVLFLEVPFSKNPDNIHDLVSK
ncbi:hypothetical protein LSTR_LSTR014595 [Laodelphax striatellus]|uniref:Mitoferrin n=1 Tax=Laodelphax striatellus TaxID=195883 RepID=A0A482WLR0_LAOST|nr:hypothetical protein LSTR_LSTR014595 [Laodelphax striatellus]